MLTGVNLQTTAAIAKELLKSGNSPTAEALAKAAASVVTHKNSATTPSMAKPLLQQQPSQTQSSQVVRPKDQLLYLAQLLGFQVQFSDFPKVLSNYELIFLIGDLDCVLLTRVNITLESECKVSGFKIFQCFRLVFCGLTQNLAFQVHFPDFPAILSTCELIFLIGGLECVLMTRVNSLTRIPMQSFWF